MDFFQVLILCVFLYSGAGQYMIPNMWIAGAPIVSIIASVSLINTRQILYGASLSRYCDRARKRGVFLFAASVTDESFGVNSAQFKKGDWSIKQATLVNLFSQTSWTLSNLLGLLMGSLLSVPTAVASFAMTAIFICLLFSQEKTFENIIAGVFAVIGVVVCKCIGLEGPAILLGALLGIGAALVAARIRRRS